MGGMTAKAETLNPSFDGQERWAGAAVAQIYTDTHIQDLTSRVARGIIWEELAYFLTPFSSEKTGTKERKRMESA